MEYREPTDLEQDLWDSLANHPMQTWAWGGFRKLRQDITRLGVYEDGKLVRGFLITWTKLFRWSVGYLPMGPLPTKEDLRALRDEGKKKRALFIRMEPLVEKGAGTLHLPLGHHLFKPKTLWWDLKQPTDRLLENMHSKTRYNIRVAQKHGVQVHQEDSSQALELHIRLLMDTAKRQGVTFHSPNYHRQLWEVLQPKLFLARYDNTVLASAMVFRHKDFGYYAYGGNALEHREVMASTLLLWEIALILKKDGLSMFDLWGTEEGKGFSQFKQKFGASVVEMIGTYDLPISQLLYPLFRVAEEARWIVRKIWR